MKLKDFTEKEQEMIRLGLSTYEISKEGRFLSGLLFYV